jgi:23S rRNA (cytidine1920-2'-O)/16S rRNA (cytidine1409-2'-O)-methyltransferase
MNTHDKSRKTEKQRIDLLLAERGYAPSRERAQGLILAGKVFVNGRMTDKAGTKVSVDAEIEVKSPDHPYVSRGGLKLRGALDAFEINPQGMTALDVGCSTGGFTDCLLQSGASKVFALDVGKGVLDYKMRTDPRVNVIEGLNARYLQYENVGEAVDIIVVDVAFISLTLILPNLGALLRDNGILLPLVKPQFEVGKDEVESGGVIRSKEKHITVLEKIMRCGVENGYDCLGAVPSPIEGQKGNREYFLFFRKTERTPLPLSADDIIKSVSGTDSFIA